jgi:hypothetical protein
MHGSVRITVPRLPKLAFAGCIVLVGLVYFGFIRGCTSTTPHPRPPKGAKDVHFYEWTAWQSWSYAYRFDASPEACHAFAVTLMERQSFRRSGAVIKTNVFTKPPVVDLHLPGWFDVTSVTNGTLLTCDDWSYAVVDLDRGRLYYYNSN